MAKKGTKDVKVTYHSLSIQMWKKRGRKYQEAVNEKDTTEMEMSEEDVTEEEIEYEDVKKSLPFYEIENIVSFIMAKRLKYRIYTFKNDKFGYIDYATTLIIDDNITDIKLCFESARNEFRPKIIDKLSGEKKNNPRQKYESDINKSHIIIRIDKAQEEVFVFLEKNHFGITLGSFVNYINAFTRMYYEKKKQKKEFSIIYFDIKNNNFITELESSQRMTVADVYIDKQLLGEKSLNFSRRMGSIRKEVVLTVKSELGESIKSNIFDFYAELSGGENIKRIKARGIDDNGHNIILDTQSMDKCDTVNVDVNDETGEINATQLFTFMTKIANSNS